MRRLMAILVSVLVGVAGPAVAQTQGPAPANPSPMQAPPAGTVTDGSDGSDALGQAPPPQSNSPDMLPLLIGGGLIGGALLIGVVVNNNGSSSSSSPTSP